MPKNAPAGVSRAGGAPAGFTLIEILVTVVLIALGCLAVLWMQAVAMRANSQSEHLTVASTLAKSEIERLKCFPFEDLKKAVTDTESGVPINREGLTQTQGGRAPRPYTRTIRLYEKQPTTRSHQVEVRVAWRDAHGDHEVVYTAVLTSDSLN